MSYLDDLRLSANKYKSLICMGMDPVLDSIPQHKDGIRNTIFFFYENILNEILRKNIRPSAVKPNYAFYAQYGFEGLKALADLITLYKSEGFIVILDVKRGDVGKTAAAYAYESFEFFGADSVTLSPYLGYDSIEPFVKTFPDKGYYILCRTSNKTAGDIQDLDNDGITIYERTAELITDWHSPGIGAVTGATYTDELEKILKIFNSKRKDIPLLIPGIGTQGGDLEKVVSILRDHSEPDLHRINSSSGINYAYRKYPNMSFAEAAVEEIKILNADINSVLIG